jgi:hypothetical protein
MLLQSSVPEMFPGSSSTIVAATYQQNFLVWSLLRQYLAETEMVDNET